MQTTVIYSDGQTLKTNSILRKWLGRGEKFFAIIEEFEKVIRIEKFKKILKKSGGTPETLILESKFYAVSRRSAAKAKRIKIVSAKEFLALQGASLILTRKT